MAEYSNPLFPTNPSPSQNCAYYTCNFMVLLKESILSIICKLTTHFLVFSQDQALKIFSHTVIYIWSTVKHYISAES